MSHYKNIKKTNSSIISFNPSSFSKLINVNIKKNNGNPSHKKKNVPLIFNHIKKNSTLYKSQKAYLNNNKKSKVLDNEDLTNDIKTKNNNNIYKISLSSNNTNNYYTRRRNQLINNKTIESESSQSRNYNKYNGNSLTKTTWSTLSFNDGKNNINQLYNGYDNKYNNIINNKNKIQNLKNKNNYNNQFKLDNFNEYNLNKLKENGIKYCIDKDGNPMNISDIKLKNKSPIAFIIQKHDKNILVDLENRAINPDHNGDYILPQKPYFIIRKYDVQYPELRNKNYGKNINYNKVNRNKNYISINVNDSNENNLYNNGNIKINNEKQLRKKNNKSCNLYSFSKFGEELNKIFQKIDNNDINSTQNIINRINPKSHMKINVYKKFKNNLRDKKKKYIFVNKLNNTNEETHLNININNDNYSTKLISLNNTCKNKEINYKCLYNNNNLNDINIKGQECFTEKNKKNSKFFIKNINGLKKKANKLKSIKCFTHKEIKNLEFKFERLYKNKNITCFIQPSYLTEFKFDKINDTPKENSKILDDIRNESNTNNYKKEKNEESMINKKNLIENIDNLDLKKYKNKRSSYSLNEFMFNNMDRQNNFSTPNNMVNTLSTLNHSYFSPPTETTSYTTIQNLHRELEKNKRFPLKIKNSNLKKFNSFKYYLKPRIKSQKVFHKRIKTEDMDKGGRKYKFFKSINDNNNMKNNYNSIRIFYSTGLDFSLKNCQHNNIDNTEKKLNPNNSNLCKCPYCHHLFYNQ